MSIDIFKDKINLIYDFLLNKNNYLINQININNINESDIEIKNNDLSKDILKQIIDQQLQYLYTINDDVYFKLYSNNISSLIKITMSNKSYNDNYFSYILSEFVLNDKTNNILLPIFNINVNIQDIKNILTNNKLPLMMERYLNSNKDKIIGFKLREGFSNLVPLSEYLKENNINYKSFLFRIIFTLSIIKRKYNKFKHNNLLLDNIFVYLNKADTEILRLGDQTFNLPNDNYQIKITNFEDSTLDNEEPIDDDADIVESDELKEKNSDLNMLANNILKLNKNIDLETKNFLTKLRYMKNNNIESLLNDDYFKEFNKEINKKINFKGKRVINSKYNMILESDNESVLGNQKKLVRTQKGGYNYNMPYKAERNNPFKSNDERTTFSKKKKEDEIESPVEEVEEPGEPFKTNDEKKTFYKRESDFVKPDYSKEKPYYKEKPEYTKEKPYYKEKPDYRTHAPAPDIPPVYVPLYDPAGQSMFVSNMLNPKLSQPMVKNYNISLANPLHDYTTISRVFEDVLPGDPSTFGFTTTYERTQIINFIRNLINNDTDAESMNVSGGENSILSSVKILDLNPYSLNKNPYLDLGKNFILYRGAYPIRYDEAKHSIFVSKMAQGINIRLYNLSLGELNGDTINVNINNYQYNMWRELRYYKHIKDNILAKKISPNFISFILYKIDTLSNIHWNKLRQIQQKQQASNYIFKTNTKEGEINLDNKKVFIQYVHDKAHIMIPEYVKLKDTLSPYGNFEFSEIDPSNPIFTSIIKSLVVTKYPLLLFRVNNKIVPYTGIITFDNLIKFISDNIITIGSIININNDSGKSLVLLTEAPNNNIIKWASPYYEVRGSLKKMIATGFHKKEVWKSILFQMINIFYVLQKEKIYFEELALEKNFYIKDMYYEPNNLNYWIYNIDGLDYYVPNYGYIVLFDSKYSDIDDKKYKIISSKLFPDKNDKGTWKNDTDFNFEYSVELFKKMKSIIDPDVFSSKLNKQGGLEPEDDILDLIRKINVDPDKNLENYMFNYFGEYLHNRAGTLLMRTEKEIINILNRPTFNRVGELIVKQERFDVFKWVIFNGKKDNLIEIINRDDQGIAVKELVNTFSLLSYPEVIKPTDIEERNIIETYKI
jgi:hypothetical protein